MNSVVSGGSRTQMKMTPGGNNSMNDTIVMKKGELMTPGGAGDFDKRKNQRSIKALEVLGDGKTDKGSTPTPGKEKSTKKAFRVCS